jgi:hypothetical protein
MKSEKLKVIEKILHQVHGVDKNLWLAIIGYKQQPNTVRMAGVLRNQK